MALDQSNEWGHFLSLQEISYEQPVVGTTNSSDEKISGDISDSVGNDKDKHNNDSSSSSSSSTDGSAMSTSTGTVGTVKINYMLAVFKRL